MIDEKLFSHAVTVASAFVANGDVRWAGTKQTDKMTMGKVEDLVVDFYSVLQRAQSRIDRYEDSGENRSPDPQIH